jgi:ABC-type multidrug transport system ATPase subunit
MIINLDKVSKRYTRHWIIRNLTLQLVANEPYALLGANGSGKSTLLKIISGFLSPSKGTVHYRIDDAKIKKGDIYKHVSFAAPYVSPLKDLTIEQMLDFMMQFKKLRNHISANRFYEALQLPINMDSRISELSSGQQQRVHLALAVMADTEILLLDEPGSYLDENSKVWFQNLLAEHLTDRLTIIASNDRSDLVHAVHLLNIEDYK